MMIVERMNLCNGWSAAQLLVERSAARRWLFPTVCRLPHLSSIRTGVTIPPIDHSFIDRRCKMTPLRQRMLEDMQLRGLAARTQESYLAAVQQLALHYGKSPDLIAEEELRQYF